MTYLQPLNIADIKQNLMITINIEVGRMRRGKAQLNTQFFIPEIRKAIMSQRTIGWENPRRTNIYRNYQASTRLLQIK